MPVTAVDLRERLSLAGFADPDVALTFGDVLAAGHARRGLARIAYRLSSIAAAMLPPVRRGRRPELADVLLLSAGHDLRSTSRLLPLERHLNAEHRHAKIWPIGTMSALAGPTLRGLLLCPRIPFREVLNAWRALRMMLRDETVDSAEALELARWVIVQHARTRYFTEVLSQCPPKLVVSDFDRGVAGSPAVRAAKQLGVTTVTILHGDPNQVGYTPFLADVVAPWSDAQRAVLRQWDANVSLMAPVGAHWIGAAQTRKNRTDIPMNVLFAHSGEEGLGQFARAMSAIAHNHGRSNCKLRPHPLSIKDEISWAQREWHLADGPLADELEWADIVYCEQSSICFDALLAGCEVRVFGSPILASLLGLDAAPPFLAEDGWYALPAATDQWPFRRTSDDALVHLIAELNRYLTSVTTDESG